MTSEHLCELREIIEGLEKEMDKKEMEIIYLKAKISELEQILTPIPNLFPGK